MDNLKLFIIIVFNLSAVLEILKETNYFRDWIDSECYEKHDKLLKRFHKVEE